MKFVFPRGDATSLLFGFDAVGKVTDVAVGGMAATDRDAASPRLRDNARSTAESWSGEHGCEL